MQDDLIGIVKTKEFPDYFPTSNHQLIKWSKVQMSKPQIVIHSVETMYVEGFRGGSKQA